MGVHDPAGPCGSTITVFPGQPVQFTIDGSVDPTDPGYLGDIGSHTVTFTLTDSLGQAVQCTVTIRVFEAGSFIPFDPLIVTKLTVDKRPKKGTFEFRGDFTLGAGSNGIDPLTEDVTIQLDGFSLTVPGGFVEQGRGEFKFNGVIDGIRINAELKAPRGGGRRSDLWTFKFMGKDATPEQLQSIENPVDTALTIGNDSGAETVDGRIKS